MRAGCPASVGQAIVIDEIGLESGIYGGFRLRSYYQPIFRRRYADLVPVAVSGLVLPQLAGRPVVLDHFLDRVRAGDRAFIDAIGRVLHLRNHRNVGAEGLKLWFTCDASRARNLSQWLREALGMKGGLPELQLQPELLICEIDGSAQLDRQALAACIDAIRRLGIRIAVDGFGAAQAIPGEAVPIRPDFVRIDASWFRRLCCDQAALDLFGAMVRSLGRNGTEVLVEGIDGPGLLCHALSSGASLLKGDLLGRPAPVGTILDERPIAVDALLSQQGAQCSCRDQPSA